jgi:hypothetical protein
VNMLVRVVCDCGGKARGTHKSSVVPARSPLLLRCFVSCLMLCTLGYWLSWRLPAWGPGAQALATWCWGSEPWSLYGRKLYVRQSLQLGPGGLVPWRLLVSVAQCTGDCMLFSLGRLTAELLVGVTPLNPPSSKFACGSKLQFVIC